MKIYEVMLLGANFANSLFMAFVLMSMYIQQQHAITLIEPNSLIITAETVTSVCIVTVTVAFGVWKMRTIAEKK